jgi:hypothetical protein
MHKHLERHYAERIGWLRAAVMGANDGIVSTPVWWWGWRRHMGM